VAINALNFNLANPLLYVVPPLLLLLCLGARPAELGLSLPNTRADWNRIALLIFIMGFINLSYLSVSLVLGGFSPATLGRRLLTNLHFNPF